MNKILVVAKFQGQEVSLFSNEISKITSSPQIDSLQPIFSLNCYQLKFVAAMPFIPFCSNVTNSRIEKFG